MAVPLFVLLVIVVMCAPVGTAVTVGKMYAAVTAWMMGMGVCIPVAVCVGMDILAWGLTEQENKGCGPLSVAFVHAVAHG